MTATVAEPSGARARQTYYWRVRNARTRHRPKTTAQAWHIQPGHPGGAYSDLGHELDPRAHHAPTLLSRSRPTGRRGRSRSSAPGVSPAGGKAPRTPEAGSGTATTTRWRTRTTMRFPAGGRCRRSTRLRTAGQCRGAGAAGLSSSPGIRRDGWSRARPLWLGASTAAKPTARRTQSAPVTCSMCPGHREPRADGPQIRKPSSDDHRRPGQGPPAHSKGGLITPPSAERATSDRPRAPWARRTPDNR